MDLVERINWGRAELVAFRVLLYGVERGGGRVVGGAGADGRLGVVGAGA